MLPLDRRYGVRGRKESVKAIISTIFDKKFAFQPTETDGKTRGDDGKEMYVYIGENRLKVDLANNSSADALVGLLRKGDVSYSASDYRNFEKVGDIGYTLPRNDTQIAVSPGDVILYQGKSLCLYYGKNTYTFTKIGKINGYSESELKTLLYAGQGAKEVRLSLR